MRSFVFIGRNLQQDLFLNCMTLFTVRPATLEDLELLYKFEQGIITAERPFNETIQPGHIHYYDLKEMITQPNVHVVVALDGNKLIGSGYARIEPAKHYLRHTHHSYLGFMFVEPAYRGKGVNQLIIDTLKRWSISQGIYELRLHVYQDNDAAIRAYEKTGFKKHLIEMRMGLKDEG